MVDIKAHFEKMAGEYDEIIFKIAPQYQDMLDAVILGIPFDQQEDINVLDLGCGTGNLSKSLKLRYKNARLTCVDIATDMIDIAKARLTDFSDIDYIQSDIKDFKSKKKYHVVMSTLALHHIREDSQKQEIYNAIYHCLADSGIFMIGDIILGATDHLEKVNAEKWIQHMNKSIPLDQIKNKWVPRHYETDRPCKLSDELKWLEQAGFKHIDVVWKYFNIAVYGAMK